MRNLQGSREDFVQEVKSLVPRTLRIKLIGTSLGSVYPEQFLEYLERNPRFRLKSYDLTDLELLAIGSWFLPPEFGTILRADIWQKVESTVDKINRQRINLFLSSKDTCLTYLLDVDSKWSRETWFGNLQPQLQKLLEGLGVTLDPIKQRKVPKYSGYCRGYASAKQGRRINPHVLENNRIYHIEQSIQRYQEEISQLHEIASGLYIVRKFKESEEICRRIKDLRLLVAWAQNYLKN